ncbi:MAG: prolyl oligopeptidase family serine peptidase [Pseudonocardiaceae bacterium]|nr:prolyl oligopeptidase family serine peptidase [Pseudonocardiaceae bacterium]
MTLDLDSFLALPRLSQLLATPDGRLVVHRALPDANGTRFAATLVEVNDGGTRPLAGPRPGLAAVAATPGGDLLLTDRRPDPSELAASDGRDGDEVAALWELPAAGGEAQYLAGTPAGIDTVCVARQAGTVVATSAVFRTASGVDSNSLDSNSLDADRELAKARTDAGTTALWFDRYPVRHWDTHLAQRAPRLLVLDRATGTLRDLTGDVGWALREASVDITPDGSTVLSTWETPAGGGSRHRDLVAIDVATGQRRVLAHEQDVDYGELAASPDGRYVAVCRETRYDPVTPARIELWLVPLDGGPVRRLAPDFEHWPRDLAWTPDGTSLLFAADEAGRAPLWRLDVEDPEAAPVRLADDGAFSDIAVTSGAVYALRSRIATPPEVVALDPEPGRPPRVLYGIEPEQPWPGRVEEVSTTAGDGTPLRAWLVLPADSDGPAPLLIAVHGGPLASWNGWHWRWQPQLFAARGYAVLLPDPALSTGYGQAMIERGWDQWGGTPYDDVLALTDAAIERDDVDGARTAVAGGSYGGYLTNWIIGHTDRFRAAVTHASLWDLQAFRGVTDDAVSWERWFGDPERDAEHYRRWSPSTHAGAIRTPTLVVHGEQDYRVPVGEGLALYTELQRRDVPSALLYLPDENHWVARPGNIRVWYDAVLAWLDHHVLGEPWRCPELL